MPVHSYFSKRDDRKLTMPRASEGTADANGLVLHGDILTGKLSVQDAFAIQAGRVSQALALSKRAVPDNYDPVLKSHLGIE
jgi:hypothetical protein